MKVEVLSSDPQILLLRDFISSDEGACLLGQAEKNFTNSKVTCSEANGCVSDYRTSSTAYLPSTKVNGIIAKRGMTFAKLGFAEDLQVVRYFPGQQFKPHLDAFDPSTFEGRKELAGFGGRQRDATLLIYLNKPEAGGATRFERLGLEVAPEPGAALYWKNVDPRSGKIDHRTLHAGLPVESGVKFAVNLWLRGEKALAGFAPGRGLGALQLTGRRNFSSGGIEKSGRIGEFPPAADADKKVKVEREVYQGTTPTLLKMAAYIREGSVSPTMQQFAELIVKNAGYSSDVHLSNSQAADILLTYVKKNVRYRPDPDNQELVKSPFITLCVPGASMCIPFDDCDGLCVALGSLMGAYGIPVRIMKQTFGADANEEHVLIIFKTDDGRWLPADPSAPLDKSIGWMARDESHIVIDPLDPTDSGNLKSELVSIGKIPLSFETSQRLPPRKMLGVMSAHDEAVALQTRLQDLFLATELAVEACGTKFTSLQDSQWTAFSQQLLTYVSADPDTIDLAVGGTLAQELSAWSDALRAVGCTGAVPAPIPIPAPAPPSSTPSGDEWPGVLKLGLYVALAGVGVYGLSQVVQLIKVGEDVSKRFHPAAAAASEKRRRAA